TSLALPVGPNGEPAGYLTPGATQIYVYNPQPPYAMDWSGWGPRLSVDFDLSKHTTLHAGCAVTTILPNLWLQNYVTGAFSFVFQPLLLSQPGSPLNFQDSVATPSLPPASTKQSGPLLASA